MKVIHELCAYDRSTELIAVEYVIPADLIAVVRTMVSPEPDDDDLVLAYDITPENARLLASLLGVSIDADLYDYTIEACAPGEDVPINQGAFTEAR